MTLEARDGASEGPQPTGSIDDGSSKSHPFKLYRGIAPTDKESGELLSAEDYEKAHIPGVVNVLAKTLSPPPSWPSCPRTSKQVPTLSSPAKP